MLGYYHKICQGTISYPSKSPPGPTAYRGHGLIIEASPSHSGTPHSVGLLWTSDQPDLETSTSKHTTLRRDRYPHPRRYSYPQPQRVSGRRLTLQTVRPVDRPPSKFTTVNYPAIRSILEGTSKRQNKCTSNFGLHFLRIMYYVALEVKTQMGVQAVQREEKMEINKEFQSIRIVNYDFKTHGLFKRVEKNNST